MDSDWADDKKERKSTSGGMIFLRGHLIKHWSCTQPTQSLSSGEAETKAVTKGAVEALYLKHLLGQQGFEVSVVIHTDASAALGVFNRLGAGKRMKHIEIQNLWVQQLVRNGLVRLVKVSTHENPADILTKHVNRSWLDYVLMMCHIRFPGEEIVENESVGTPASLAGEDQYEEDDDQNSDWIKSFGEAVEQLALWSDT